MWILSPITYLNIVALWFKSKKRNREGKQPRLNASNQFASTKNLSPEIRRCPLSRCSGSSFSVSLTCNNTLYGSCRVILNAALKPV